MGLRFVRAFLWFSLLLKFPLADAVGDICNEGDEAVWGDESEAISPANGKELVSWLKLTFTAANRIVGKGGCEKIHVEADMQRNNLDSERWTLDTKN